MSSPNCSVCLSEKSHQPCPSSEGRSIHQDAVVPPLSVALYAAEHMKHGEEFIIPTRYAHLFESLLELDVTPLYRRRYIRLVVTVNEKQYVAFSSWDFDIYKRNKRGWPRAAIYSGVTEDMRSEHSYLSGKTTITNVLSIAIDNRQLRYPKKKLRFTREELEVCQFPPTTLITVFYDIRCKEFRFHQFVEIRDNLFYLVFTLRNTKYPFLGLSYPNLLKYDLQGAVVRLITGYPIGEKTARKRRSEIDVIRQPPSGVELGITMKGQ